MCRASDAADAATRACRSAGDGGYRAGPGGSRSGRHGRSGDGTAESRADGCPRLNDAGDGRRPADARGGGAHLGTNRRRVGGTRCRPVRRGSGILRPGRRDRIGPSGGSGRRADDAHLRRSRAEAGARRRQ